MSDWPIASEYSNMLQNPQIAFRDADLKACVVESNTKTHQPKARSGAFAAVYKGGIRGRGDVAIRVFTRASGREHRDRYSAISHYLNGLNGSLPDSLVGFRFHEQGIRVASKGGKWFPLLTMEWVPGSPLFDWVRKQCHDQNSRALGDVSEKWINLIDQLCKARIAHGDLQHGNVMVTPSNQLKLVDYDCMCVPVLEGQPNLEIGVEPYQHRERNEHTKLYPGLDNFSALFILVVLRALTARPRLWFTYNEPGREEDLYDKLLFRRQDFDEPTRSALLRDLQRLPDEKVRRWSQELADLWHGPLLQVPALQQFVCDYDKVRELLSRHAFDEALALVNRRNAPADLQSQLNHAEQRVKRREQLEQAVRTGDEAAMARLYDPKLLDQYPRAKAAVAQARHAAKVLPILNRLRQARQSGDGSTLIRIWDENQAVLSSRASAKEFQSEVARWRERQSLAETVLRVATKSPCDVALLKRHWEQLKRLGGHPKVDRQAASIQRLIARHEALAAFLKLPKSATLASDQAIVSAWKESLFANWSDAEKHRPQVRAAQQRIRQFQAIEKVIRQHDGNQPTRVGEEAIAKLDAELADGYHPASQGRIEQAAHRLRAISRLEKACRQRVPSKISVAMAWRAVRAADAESLADPETKARANEAMALAPLLQNLSRISLDDPPSPERDQTLLEAWDPRLNDCTEAEPWKNAWNEARERKMLLRTLDLAIAKEDVLVIGKCVASPVLANWPFTPEQKRHIAVAKTASQGMTALIEVLRTGQRERFVDQFNMRVVTRFPEPFRKYGHTLREWIPNVIAPRSINGLAMPTLRNSCIRRLPGSSPGWEIKWTWPEPRFTDACLVKLCPSAPAADARPDSVDSVYELKVTRNAYEVSGGGRLTLRPLKARLNWKGMYVVVWASFDVPEETLTSEPLILGQLP